MTVTGSLPLNQLPEMELVEGLRAGAVDPMAFGAEVKRRVKAEQAARARKAEQTRWYEAAHAQWQRAEAYCCGNFYSPEGKAEAERVARKLSARGHDAELGNGMALWQGSDDWAERRASRELLNFWAADGGRLSLALWRRQQAGERQRARDERDLAAMDARPTVPPMSREQVARYTAALASFGARAASPAPQPGSIARYTARLEALTDQLTRQAARLAKATQSHQ